MLTEEEKSFLFTTIRKALESALEGKPLKPIIPLPKEKFPNLYRSQGVFVTLYREGQLRGCIGTLESEKPLYEEVIEVALASAFRDFRFPPLQKEELPKIEIEISLLSPFQRGKIEDIQVGKHGILIKKGSYRGLLLPQVAVEYGWDRETFLRNCCLKAGLPEDCYLSPDTEIYLFTAEVYKESEK